jgi:hypothetical protein
MKIEFLSFPGCPNAAPARRVLDRVLAVAGITDHVDEVDTTAWWTPEHQRNWGSPTILINDQDFEGQTVPAAPSCRLYTDGLGRIIGVPAETLLLAAVQRVLRGRAPNRSWRAVATQQVRVALTFGAGSAFLRPGTLRGD